MAKSGRTTDTSVAYHPISFQVEFSDLVTAASGQRRIFIGSPGGIIVRKRGEREYWYWRFRNSFGKEQEEAIGSVLDTEAKAKHTELELDIALAKNVGAISNALRRQGYASADNDAATTIGAICNAGIFREGAMLVGSHAYGVLLNNLGAKPAKNYATEDVDLARYARISLAVVPAGGIIDVLKSTGFAFFAVPGLDRRAHSTSYLRRGTRLSVDLLAPGAREEYKTIPIPELKAHATTLPYFGFLLQDPLDSVLLARDRAIPVRVPRPERYCVHKLVISQLRAQRGGAKDAKDIEQAIFLATILENKYPGIVLETASQLPRPAVRRLAAGARRAARETSNRDLADVFRQVAGRR